MSHAALAIDETERPARRSSTPCVDTFIAALRGCDLFADPAYSRPLDATRVCRMVAHFDRTLLGILDVSTRDDGCYAIIDGQHRWAAAVQVHGTGEALVCRVHSGLTPHEARLAEKTHAPQHDETWWDRWRARRAAGDPSVLTIDDVLERHQLRVNPAPEDGNVRATKALETVLGAQGDPQRLDAVLDLLTSAFGRSIDAFDGGLMQGVALVLEHYPASVLDVARLARQLQSIPPRQLRARAIALRSTHRTTVPRLCAAVIVERYNAGRGRKIRPFFERESTLRRASAATSSATADLERDHLDTECPTDTRDPRKSRRSPCRPPPATNRAPKPPTTSTRARRSASLTRRACAVRCATVAACAGSWTPTAWTTPRPRPSATNSWSRDQQTIATCSSATKEDLMGWIRDGAYDHEGWVANVLADGRVTSSVTGAGVIVHELTADDISNGREIRRYPGSDHIDVVVPWTRWPRGGSSVSAAGPATKDPPIPLPGTAPVSRSTPVIAE